MERELQMVELSATICSCIADLSHSMGSSVVTLCVTSQRVFVVVVSLRFSPETFGYNLMLKNCASSFIFRNTTS
jgi:hypothetical protein